MAADVGGIKFGFEGDPENLRKGLEGLRKALENLDKTLGGNAKTLSQYNQAVDESAVAQKTLLDKTTSLTTHFATGLAIIAKYVFAIGTTLVGAFSILEAVVGTYLKNSGKALLANLQQNVEVGLELEKMTYGLSAAVEAYTHATGDASISLDKIVEKTKQLQQTTGLTTGELQQAHLQMLDMARSTGLTADQIEALVERSAEFAVVAKQDFLSVIYGVDQAMRGFPQVLRGMGISLDDMAIQAHAGGVELGSLGTGMKSAAQTAAIFNTLMDQTSFAAGKVSKSFQTTTFGALKQAESAWSNLNQAIGESALQMEGPFLKALAKVNTEIANSLIPMAGFIAGFKLVGGVALTVLGSLVQIASVYGALKLVFDLFGQAGKLKEFPIFAALFTHGTKALEILKTLAEKALPTLTFNVTTLRGALVALGALLGVTLKNAIIDILMLAGKLSAWALGFGAIIVGLGVFLNSFISIKKDITEDVIDDIKLREQENETIKQSIKDYRELFSEKEKTHSQQERFNNAIEKLQAIMPGSADSLRKGDETILKTMEARLNVNEKIIESERELMFQQAQTNAADIASTKIELELARQVFRDKQDEKRQLMEVLNISDPSQIAESDLNAVEAFNQQKDAQDRAGREVDKLTKKLDEQEKQQAKLIGSYTNLKKVMEEIPMEAMELRVEALNIAFKRSSQVIDTEIQVLTRRIELEVNNQRMFGETAKSRQLVAALQNEISDKEIGKLEQEKGLRILLQAQVEAEILMGAKEADLKDKNNKADQLENINKLKRLDNSREQFKVDIQTIDGNKVALVVRKELTDAEIKYRAAIDARQRTETRRLSALDQQNNQSSDRLIGINAQLAQLDAMKTKLDRLSETVNNDALGTFLGIPDADRSQRILSSRKSLVDALNQIDEDRVGLLKDASIEAERQVENATNSEIARLKSDKTSFAGKEEERVRLISIQTRIKQENKISEEAVRARLTVENNTRRELSDKAFQEYTVQQQRQLEDETQQRLMSAAEREERVTQIIDLKRAEMYRELDRADEDFEKQKTQRAAATGDQLVAMEKQHSARKLDIRRNYERDAAQTEEKFDTMQRDRSSTMLRAQIEVAEIEGMHFQDLAQLKIKALRAEQDEIMATIRFREKMGEDSTKDMARLRVNMALLDRENARASMGALQGIKEGWMAQINDVEGAFGLFRDMARQTAQGMSQVFQNMFFSLFERRMFDLKAMVKQIMAQIISNMMTSLVMSGLTRLLGGALSGLGGLFGTSFSLPNNVQGPVMPFLGQNLTQGRQTGGYVDGPMSHGRDNMPMMLEAGEYVIKKQRVNQLGLGYLNRLNAGENIPSAANSGNVVVNIHNTGRNDAPKSNFRQEMRQMVVNIIYEDMQANGDLRKAFGG